MSTQQERADIADVELQLVEYLRAHPDFFLRHPALLAELHVPHESGGAVSLVERQVSVLRDQNRQLRRELMDLVQVARGNDRLNERIQRLTLALMRCTGLAAIVRTLHDAMMNEFDADAVALRLFRPAKGEALKPGVELPDTVFAAVDSEDLSAFQKIIEQRKPVCGKLRPAQLQYLFIERASEISSLALVPLTWQHDAGADDAQGCASVAGGRMPGATPVCIGLFAVGSFESGRFNPEMGTLFLSHLGALAGQAISVYLEV
ncbi:MAG: DUF484 family protein [Gammaproteobacteria bacterium]|nr:MAG: DUF484 family protein [Gammaproteobacteria bacterium]